MQRGSRSDAGVGANLMQGHARLWHDICCWIHDGFQVVSEVW